MLWLTRLLLIVLVFALVTGRAYFVRGFVSKKTNSRLYWKLVVFYLFMTSLLFVKLAIPYVEHHFSDVATRAAQDIGQSARRLQQARLSTTTLSLNLDTEPKGCSENSIFQISPGGFITIWCGNAEQGTSGHAVGRPTYQATIEPLSSVLVSETLKIEKKKGEPLFIELHVQNILQQGLQSDVVAVIGLH